MIYPKLYKRDETGSIRVWWAEVKDGSYRYHSGQLNGKITTSLWTLCDYKNIGKKNELKPAEQAHKEVQAMYTKKKKRSGYHDSMDDVDNPERIKPMLAHKFEDHKHKLKYPVYIQPKLDGIRCLATPEGLFSRRGERIASCPHIEQAIMPFVKKYGFYFDGELYNHELKDDFNEIQSLVTRKHIDEKQELKIERYVQYHIYDIVLAKPFKERSQFLMKMEEYVKPPLVIVPTHRISEPEYLDDAYEEFLTDGYEGQMVRSNSLYICKRTDALLKRKEFQDAEFKIISIHEGKGNRSGMAGYARLRGANGRTFNAAFMGTNDYRKQLLKNAKNYVNADATVKFFRLTPDGVPRFPIIKSIREKGY